MSARRCDMGCISWPDDPIFTTCTYCGETTKRVSNAEPAMSFEEARTMKLHELFEQFYERRCRTLGLPHEGPLTENDQPIILD